MPHARHTAVADTSASPFARLTPVGVADVRVTDAFWKPRLDRNRDVTIPQQHALCEETGALRNFRRAAGLDDGPFNGMYYSDSDVYKWVEAASWTLAAAPDPDLAAMLDSVIKQIAGAQDDDGYLNTYFSVDRVGERWSDLVVRHEMYCLGHLVQAAVAHFRATGDHALLDVALHSCEHVLRRFTPDERPGACGHPDLEMALVELFRTTGDTRWLQLATWQIDSRGRGVLNGSEYLLDHRPLREETTVTGHAVRALYLYAAAADVVLESGDEELRATLDRLWADLSQHKSSVTGGVGARWDGEAFGDAYELPDRAYNETCAAIAHIFLAWRLLLLTGDAAYRDAIETTLYNGVLPGLSLTGIEFFYQNPLADSGRHRREPWFECACCPPNIARLLASLPGYLYTTSDEGIWVQLYIGSDATLHLADRTPVGISMHTELPWTGSVRLEISPTADVQFTVFLPVPGWADGQLAVRVNGEQVWTESRSGYCALRRTWQPGDVIDVDLGTPVRVLATHPRVASTHDRLAIGRGPFVYCVEQTDQADSHVADLRLRGDEQWIVEHRPELLNGVTTLETTLDAIEPDAGPLHRPYRPGDTSSRRVPATMVPYYAWANRAAGPMRVYLPLSHTTAAIDHVS